MSPETFAAQYLRMSTEHQRFSLASQAAAIATYAAVHGLEIVATYADRGKSGVGIRTRAGLKQLLADALTSPGRFAHILVYDVSRWGRFQNPDEAAHYEFICRHAGLSIHYCAEQFTNDDAFASTILKHIKRVMAAEYSRELSVKVRAAHIAQARLGHVQGGIPPYGLRRQLCAADGSRRLLAPGERKALASDRVTWVPGPDEEIQRVRRIYDLYVRRGVSIYRIAHLLRREAHAPGAPDKWTYYKVRKILTNEIYQGTYVYARHTKPLGGPARAQPKAQWARARMLEPIIPRMRWLRAQERLGRHRTRKSYSEAELVDGLLQILGQNKTISARLIEASPNAASVTTYVARFGSLFAAYKAAGHHPSRRESFGRGRTRDTDEEMLQHLRRLEQTHGFVSAKLLADDTAAPCPASYHIRFGGLRNAYALAGLSHKRSSIQAAAALRRHGLQHGSHREPITAPDVRRLVEQGMSAAAASRALGISPEAASRLLRGQTHFAVPRRVNHLSND